MKTTHWIMRPVVMAALTVSVFGLSLLVVRSHEPPQASRIYVVLHARQAAVKDCMRKGHLNLSPYAKRIAHIDAAACPDDFFQAWQKYVADVQTVAAIRRSNDGKAIVSIGAAILTENPSPLLGLVPQNPDSEISLNAAVADWQNVKHVALRYGIKVAPPKYTKHLGFQRNA